MKLSVRHDKQAARPAPTRCNRPEQRIIELATRRPLRPSTSLQLLASAFQEALEARLARERHQLNPMRCDGQAVGTRLEQNEFNQHFGRRQGALYGADPD